MKHEQYDPNSHDAMFARILANQEEASRKADEILKQVQKTNGRVSDLELWRRDIKGRLGLVAAAISAVVAVVGPKIVDVLLK